MFLFIYKDCLVAHHCNFQLLGNVRAMSEKDSNIRIALIEALIVLIASLVFPVTQGYFNSAENYKKERATREQKIFAMYAFEYPRYISYYSAYLKACIAINTNKKNYLGLDKEQTALLRIKIFEKLLELQPPEVVLKTVDSCFLNKKIHIYFEKLLFYTKSLLALDLTKSKSEDECDTIVKDINKIHLKAVELMASEIKGQY